MKSCAIIFRLIVLLFFVNVFSQRIEAKTVEIKIQNFGFYPNKIEVDSGDFIKFYNDDIGSRRVKSVDFELLRLAPKASTDFLVVEPGDYEFYLENFPKIKGSFSVKEKPQNLKIEKKLNNLKNNRNSINKVLVENNQLLPATGSSIGFLYFLILILISLLFLSINKRLKTK